MQRYFKDGKCLSLTGSKHANQIIADTRCCINQMSMVCRRNREIWSRVASTQVDYTFVTI